MTDFFLAGGYAMYAISALGFLLIASSVLHALRPGPRYQRLVVALGTSTITTGILGTALGICLSCRYIHQVAAERQLGVLGMGIDESLHNLVLSSIFVLLASLIFALGAFRNDRTTAV